MLKITDAFPLREGFDCVIPVMIEKKRGKEAVVSVYEPFTDLGREFIDRFGDQLFSPDAEKWLIENIRKPIAGYGYEPDTEYGTTYSVEYSFFPSDRDRLRTDLIAPETRRIGAEELDEERNVSGLLRDEEELGALCYGTVNEAGLIVSAACENYAGMSGRGEHESEIAVATSVDHAANGYAVSNAAALTGALLERGDTVYYVCDADNYPSCRVAEKLGFEISACTYSLVCYKNEY